MSEFKSRHVIITGGGSGIGLAIARRFAAAGAHITLMGRREDRIRKAAAELGVAAAVPADVTDPESVKVAFAAARHAFGTVGILVNNAGAAETAPFAKLDLDLWRRMLDVNLTGAFLCCQAVIEDVTTIGNGRVVNIASTAGVKGYPYTAAYVAAKHGLVGLTRALAAEFARTDATFNAVCPGFTDTDIVASAVKKIAEKTGRSPEDATAELTRHSPQGRLIDPDEVADAVNWLAGPAAAGVTGQSIIIAGGEIT